MPSTTDQKSRERLNVSIRRLEVLVADNQRRPDLDLTALYRLNGLGKDLGDALDQMVEADFTDVEFGVTLAMPVGLRQRKAEAQAARYRLARDRRLLEQEMFSISHEISEASQRIDFAYREYEKAKLRLESAVEWADGARLRYMNPAPDSSSTNWMLQNLDDYFRALRFRTDAAIDVAASLNRYNVELVGYEEIKGTLLDFFAIEYLGDPCRQTARLRPSGARCPPVIVTQTPDAESTLGSEPALADPSAESTHENEEASESSVEELPMPTPEAESTLNREPLADTSTESKLEGQNESKPSIAELLPPTPVWPKTSTPLEISIKP